MIPNTFVIGAMKSATTSLCNQLAIHPDVFMARIKEPDFFSRDEEYAKGLKWYESLFQDGAGRRVVAEGSTSYTKQLQYPQAAMRLHQHAPDAKLIYLVRNPVARLQSHWAHEVLKGRTKLDVNDFVRKCPEAIDISNYWKQLESYRESFDESQLLVLFAEDFRDQPHETLNRCSRFLGIREFTTEEIMKKSNMTSDRQLDIWPVRVFRKWRWFDVRFEKLKLMIPDRLHQTLKLILKSRSAIGSSQLNDETSQWVVDQLAMDTAKFLDHFNKPADFWGAQLEPQSVDLSTR